MTPATRNGLDILAGWLAMQRRSIENDRGVEARRGAEPRLLTAYDAVSVALARLERECLDAARAGKVG